MPTRKHLSWKQGEKDIVHSYLPVTSTSSVGALSVAMFPGSYLFSWSTEKWTRESALQLVLHIFWRTAPLCTPLLQSLHSGNSAMSGFQQSKKSYFEKNLANICQALPAWRVIQTCTVQREIKKKAHSRTALPWRQHCPLTNYLRSRLGEGLQHIC